MRRPDRPRHWTAVRVAAAGILVASLVGGPTGTVQASAIRVVSHGDRSQRVIALTFDDGVSPANCRRILATLVEQHVPATFFPIAEAMSLDPAFWRLVAQVGDPIGDHTWSHPQMPTLSEAAQFTQIDRARRAAESILGRPILRVFRPPYGAYNAATLKAAADAGFGTALRWDVSDADTSKSGTVARMRARAELGTDGSVVLMHCGPNATPYLLPDVIAWYRDRGFRFVTVPRLLGFPWSPGSTSPVSPARILGSLPALPSTSSGGPITGANGYFPPSTPTPTPAPQPTPRPSPRATPAPTSTPHPTPPPTPTVTAAPSAFAPSSTSPIATPAGSPTAPTPSARTVSLASERSADATLVDEIVALTGLALIAVLAIGSVALVRRARRG